MTTMRDLIRIVEGRARVLWLYDDPEAILPYIEDWEHREDLGDGLSGPFDLAHVKAAQTALQALVGSRHSITVYRSMVLSERTVGALAAGDSLGQSWTAERRLAHPYNHDGRARVHYVFEADAGVDQVDWLATIALWGNGEQEIRMRPDGHVVLRSVTLTTLDGRAIERVREDLSGESFRTSGTV